MELSGCFLERNKTWLCFLPSCREHFHCKITSLENQKLENIGIDSFSSWAPQNSAELQDYLVTSLACAHLSTGKAVLHLVEAQEEMCDLSPSLSSDRSANNIMGRASNPLMTNAVISWCQLISACSSWCINTMNWDHQWRRCQGMDYKAAKEPLPPFPPKELVGARHQGSHHSTAVLPWALVTNPSLSRKWFCVQELKLTGLLVPIPNFLVQQSSKTLELSQISILSPLQWNSHSLTKPLVLFFCFDFFSQSVKWEKKHKVHSIKYLILIFLSFHTVLHSTVYIKIF